LQPRKVLYIDGKKKFKFSSIRIDLTSIVTKAEVAHLVEHDLAKVGVAGSSPVFRSEFLPEHREIFFGALVVELVDTQDLKSCDPQRS
jgi:hypothetical protein